MKKLLLTAFEPFGGHSINASLEAARSIREKVIEGVQVEILQVPVERFRSLEIVLKAVERYKPDIIVMLGEASGRAAITPERVAINVDEYSIPDNAGKQPREETIFDNAPAAYFSTLPIVAIKDGLLQNGIPAAISNSAGTYVCNHLFYGVMHHLFENGNSARAGFIHLPLLPEQVTDERPCLSGELESRGIQMIISLCAANSV